MVTVSPAIMRPVSRLLALAALLALIALIGLAAFAVSLRYRGRPVPRGLIYAIGALVGLGHGIAAVLLIREPLVLASAVTPPAVLVWATLSRGLRRAAGVTLLAFGLPAALWWGWFVIRDALDPTVAYLPTLWGWWALGALPAVAGATLIVIGDRAAPPVQVFPRAGGQVRDPAPVASALSREISIGPFPLPSLVAEIGLILPLTLAIPAAIGVGVPWPVAWVVGAVVYAGLASEIWYHAMPRRARKAWEGFALLGHPEIIRWRETTGTSVPTNKRAMQKWLRAPDRPETRWARADLLAMLGDLDEARATAQQIPVDSELDAFERDATLDYIDWLRGADLDLDALQRRAESTGRVASSERLQAEGMVALAEARHLAWLSGDWAAPLIAFRNRDPATAGRWLRSDLRRGRFPRLLLLGLAVAGLTAMLSQSLGG
jgi:hypothetical protein